MPSWPHNNDYSPTLYKQLRRRWLTSSLFAEQIWFRLFLGMRKNLQIVLSLASTLKTFMMAPVIGNICDRNAPAYLLTPQRQILNFTTFSGQAVWSLPTPERPGSNPVVTIFTDINLNCSLLGKDENTEKRPGMASFRRVSVSVNIRYVFVFSFATIPTYLPT